MASLTRPITWAYDLDPTTGGTYSLDPGGNWVRTETPRMAGPTGLRLRAPKTMRDVTDPTTYAATGGTPQTAGGGRRFLPPVITRTRRRN